MIVAPGTTSQSIDIQITDDSGLAVTGLVAATFPSVYWSIAGNTAATAITLSDLAAITTAYSSGGVKERTGSAGVYRLDIPNAALANAGAIKIYGEASGKHLICEPIVVANVPANVTQLLGTAWLTPGTAGTPDVNVKQYAGQTAAVGSDNLPKVGLWSILGSALSETVAGYLAAAFKKFFNVATPTLTTGGTDQTGDSYARIGAGGAGLTAIGDTRLAHLDADVSSRLATSGYTAPLTATQVENAVWNATESSHLTAGSTGAALNAAGSAGDPWTTALPGSYTAGQAGYIVGHNLNAAITSLGSPQQVGTKYAVTLNSSDVTGNVPAHVLEWNGTAVAGPPPDKIFISSHLALSATASTITLSAAEPATDNYYRDHLILIVSGTGAGQSAIITGYVGATNVATIDGTWAVTPDATSLYVIMIGAVSVLAASQSFYAPATVAALATVATNVSNCLALVQADEYTDTGVNPWARVLMVRGSGGIGVGTELLRQKLYDSAGAAITDTTTVIAGAHV